MKVKELIELLQDYDQDATVVVRGYEGGYNTASRTHGFYVVENFYENDRWMGRHESVEVVRDYYNNENSHNHNPIPAVLVI